MTRKQVLLLPAWYPSPEHPVNGIFIKDQAECLAAGHDVTVLAPRLIGLRDGGLPVLQPRPVVQAGLDGLQEWHVTQRVLPPLATLPLLRRYLLPEHAMIVHARRYWKAVERGFKAYVRARGLPDVIHAHVVLPAGWAAARLGARYGVPTVLTEHSGPFSVHLETPEQRRLVREAFGGLGRVLAVSPALVGHIHHHFPTQGQWAAFTSLESGAPEIQVRRFPMADTGGRWKVSTGGGQRARWSADGRTIYYQSADNTEIRAVGVTPGTPFAVGTTRTIMKVSGMGTGWDVDRATGRILVTEPVAAPGVRIVVMQHWLDQFRRGLAAR